MMPNCTEYNSNVDLVLFSAPTVCNNKIQYTPLVSLLTEVWQEFSENLSTETLTSNKSNLMDPSSNFFLTIG